MTVVETFAEFVAGLEHATLPETARHGAKRSLLDWYGAAAGGGVLAPATLLSAVLVHDGGRARLIPSAQPADARTAVLINGTAAHTLEVDDIYREGLYHPGAQVVAAALALGEDRGVSGAALLDAIIAGYEVSNRIAEAVNPAHYRYWHTTGTVGFFGAAAAAAAILQLDAARTAHALATAGTFAAGLQQAFRSDAMSKPLHAGRAAEGGVLAALAAEAGVTGALDILEGPAGFGAAMSEAVDWAAATRDLGERFTIEAMSQKRHACCGHTFAAIDAALHLRDQEGVAVEDIETVTVASYGAALEICGNPEPRTAFEAKFSLPYCVAAAWALGRVGPAAFSAEALNDPEIKALMARVRLERDAVLDAAFPAQRAATVRVTTHDGRAFGHHRPTRKGDPDDPLSDTELSAKFRDLADPVLGAGPAADLEIALWRIDTLDDVRDLPLRAPSTQSNAAE